MEAFVSPVGETVGPCHLQDVIASAKQQDGREGPGNCGDIEHADHAPTTGFGLGMGSVPDAVADGTGDRSSGWEKVRSPMRLPAPGTTGLGLVLLQPQFFLLFEVVEFLVQVSGSSLPVQ